MGLLDPGIQGFNAEAFTTVSICYIVGRCVGLCWGRRCVFSGSDGGSG